MSLLEDELTKLGWEDNPAYGTHMSFVCGVISEIFPEEIFIEVGAGRHGTPWLANFPARDSITIEDVSEEVADVFKRLCSGPSHTVDYCVTPEYLRRIGENTPIGGILIDGARHLRREWLKIAFEEEIPYIILHDSNVIQYYGYYNVKVPPQYIAQSYVHEDLGVYTTVFTTRAKSSSAPHDHNEGGGWPDVDHRR